MVGCRLYTQLYVYIIILFTSLYLSVHPKDNFFKCPIEIETWYAYNTICSNLEPTSLVFIEIVKKGLRDNGALEDLSSMGDQSLSLSESRVY